MASSNQWAFDIETNVYSKIYSQAKARYPNAYITREEQSNTTPEFPTILIQALTPVEKNADLETQINSVLFSTQITVTTNKSRSDALNIANTMAQLYKRLSFELVGMPYCRKDDKLWTAIIRARRTFDWNDRL